MPRVDTPERTCPYHMARCRRAQAVLIPGEESDVLFHDTGSEPLNFVHGDDFNIQWCAM
jgi:hypothetical protein